MESLILSSGTRWQAPFIRAPEASRSIFLVILMAASAPLAAGVAFFGFRALVVAALSVLGCIATETAYYRVTRTPALLGRTHAAVTGLLLALTLPATAPWYVPLTGAVLAIILGKALFGGVGHFLWQPALVGRLAVAVIFAPPLCPSTVLNPTDWAVLAQGRVIVGDIHLAKPVAPYRQWRGAAPAPGADAIVLPRPAEQLRALTLPHDDPPGSIALALSALPPAGDLILGAYPGGIGETCAIAIIIAGLYLVYRNYVSPHLPAMFILGAALTAAIAPVRPGGPAGAWHWLPLLSEGIDVGFIYVMYQLLCAELLLAAWLLATEMTSRPVTAPGQAVFGFLCGAVGILLRLYVEFPIPIYAAVLLGNTFTPLIDALIRPRVLGKRRWWQKSPDRRAPQAGLRRGSI